LRGFGILLYAGAVLMAAMGLLIHSKELLAVACLSGGLGYAIRDYFGRSGANLTVMTFYTAGSAFWFGVGNLAGYLLADTPFAPKFYQFEAPAFLFEAQMIGVLATFIPALSFDALRRRSGSRHLGLRVPAVGFSLTSRQLVMTCLAFVALDWTVRLGGFVIGGLGTISALVDMGSNIAIFALTLLWIDQPTTRRWGGLALPAVIMLFSATYSFLFYLLRTNLVLAVGAFFLPFLLRRALNLRRAAVGLAFVALFVLVFEPLGAARGQSYGTERITAVASQVRAADPDSGRYGVVGFLARLSTFNQLSQVVAIADAEGFYEGRTLAYLAYVFIPRAIWSDKPTITPGRWFAEKLGRGTYLPGVGFSNAINMTVPGELYLNFGWLGTIAGLALMGVLYHLFWDAAAELRRTTDIVAVSFGLILLNQAVFGGSHFGAVVNIVIWYIAALLATWGFNLFSRRRTRIPAHSAPGRPRSPGVGRPIVPRPE
jgi:hypothetical protein